MFTELVINLKILQENTAVEDTLLGTGVILANPKPTLPKKRGRGVP